MIKRSLLTVALVAASAGAVHAQSEPVDPYGRPLIGRNDWVRQAGDQPGPTVGASGRTTVMTTTSSAVGADMAAVPPAMAPMPANTAAGEPVDPYGRPLVGRNDWVRQPGDQMGNQRAGMSSTMKTAPSYTQSSADMSDQIGAGPYPVAFKDEYGFRYDARGNRLDARGYVISPQTR